MGTSEKIRNQLSTYIYVLVTEPSRQVTLCGYHYVASKKAGANLKRSKGIAADECELCKQVHTTEGG